MAGNDETCFVAKAAAAVGGGGGATPHLAKYAFEMDVEFTTVAGVSGGKVSVSVCLSVCLSVWLAGCLTSFVTQSSSPVLPSAFVCVHVCVCVCVCVCVLSVRPSVGLILLLFLGSVPAPSLYTASLSLEGEETSRSCTSVPPSVSPSLFTPAPLSAHTDAASPHNVHVASVSNCVVYSTTTDLHCRQRQPTTNKVSQRFSVILSIDVFCCK